MTTSPDSIRIKPRVYPRDGIDFCISAFAVLPVQMFLFFGLPAGFAYFVLKSWTLAEGVLWAIGILYVALSVWSITLTPEGIRFTRLIGFPKFLPWKDILSVEVAPRGELIRHGWLWPLLPAREMTASFSSLGHYRIRWQTGFCYYPPADRDAFEEYVRRHLRARTGSEDHAS